MESATALVKAHQTLNNPATPGQEPKLYLEIDDPGFDPSAPAPLGPQAPVPAPLPSQPQTVNLLNPGAPPQPAPVQVWPNALLPAADGSVNHPVITPVGQRQPDFINPAKRQLDDNGNQLLKQQRIQVFIYCS